MARRALYFTLGQSRLFNAGAQQPAQIQRAVVEDAQPDVGRYTRFLVIEHGQDVHRLRLIKGKVDQNLEGMRSRKFLPPDRGRSLVTLGDQFD